MSTLSTPTNSHQSGGFPEEPRWEPRPRAYEPLDYLPTSMWFQDLARGGGAPEIPVPSADYQPMDEDPLCEGLPPEESGRDSIAAEEDRAARALAACMMMIIRRK